jgi:endonuclease/exonuclease/phosphatase (EEP) superfamily protein YafD
VLVGVVGGCHSGPKRQPVAAAPAQPHVSVMTFNVNFGMAGDPATMNAVAQQDADVIFLQETTDQWEAELRTRFGEAYPSMAFKHWPPAGGLAVLSKLPIESIEYLPAESWFPAARVVLASPVGRLQVLNVHLRPPASDRGNVVSGYFSTPPVRRREISAFASALDPTLPTLIVGDFNESENGRAVKWLAEHGYRSALPEFQPGAKTWRWRTSVGTLRGRYDHLCYDGRLTPLRVEVRDVGRSDHLPVVGVFALNHDAPPTTQRSIQQ